MSGQRGRAKTQSSSTSPASPSQVAGSPAGSSAGTATAPVAMPMPTPAMTTPPAAPRRSGATEAWVAGPASAISSPPATPAMVRHSRNHQKPPFQVQAAIETTTSPMPRSSSPGTPSRRAVGRPASVPMR